MVLILGDNIFAAMIWDLYASAMTQKRGATVFAYHVHDPERYGLLNLIWMAKSSLWKKTPFQNPNYAVTGLYFLR